VIRQLAFDLPLTEAMTRESFFAAPSNAVALQMMERWQDWPGRKLLLLGPEGAGKTHLAQVWAGMTGALILNAADLAHQDPTGLARQPVVVEDADRIGAGETALFHLHNLVTEAGALLMTATTPPRDWGLSLPDLASRMQATQTAKLEAPDDALLSAVLVKLFADRQVTVAPNLIAYLVTRIPRSISAARTVVADLDARALAAGRPITRALAGDLLDSRKT
jgi:chromosomal replication initiation ATPase DnaA